MLKKNIFLSTIFCGLCFLPGVAAAQDQDYDISAAPPPAETSSAPATEINEITLGAQWVGGTNTGLYGRYNGFTNRGLDLLLGFEFAGREGWESPDTFHYELSGLNLNYQTGDRLRRDFSDRTFANITNIDVGPQAEIELSFGNQGRWGVSAGYDAISYAGNIINSIYTVSGDSGILNNGLPPWGGASNDPLLRGATTSFTPATLSPAERPFQTGTRRDILRLGGHVFLGDWTLSANVRHEHKEGTLEESLRASLSGVAFTLPVDYDTDRFDVQAAYIQRGFQAVLQYTYSHFNDNNQGLVLPSPLSIASLTANSGPFAQSAFYSTPPSNDAHYLTLMLADNLTAQTRISANLRTGLELQDDTFPPNSADPNLSSTLGNPTFTWFNNLNSMNQGSVGFSPDARAWIYEGDFTISSQLARDVRARASYRFEGRDVRLDERQVWIGGPSPDARANIAVYVVPQDWFKQTVRAELDYNIRSESNTKLTVGYAYNDTDRTNAQVEHSRTQTVSAQLSSMLGANVMGRISYDHSERDGELVYGRPWGNLEEGMPEFFGTPSGAYYQAPMDSDSVIARLNFVPNGAFTGGIYLQYEDQRFNYPDIPAGAPAGDTNLLNRGMGIEEIYNVTVGPDVSYRPNDKTDLHFYYTYERIYYNNLGNGACAASNTGNCLGSAGYFQNEYTSDMHTAGVSATWQATPKLNLEGEYNFSIGSILFDEYNGVMVATPTQSYQNVVPYPDIDSRMHDARLTANYQFTPHMQGALYLQYNIFRNNDWNDLTPPIQPTTDGGAAISILTPGYPPPKYNVSTIGAALRLRF